MDSPDNTTDTKTDLVVDQSVIDPGEGLDQFADEAKGVSSVRGNGELGDLDETSLTELKWLRVNLFGFSLCRDKFLVSEGIYSELLVDPVISPLPNSPPHFLGLTNVRGNLVPVYQLEPLLEIPITKPSFVLVLGELSQAAGLVVRGKPEPLPKNELIETDSAMAQSGLHALLKDSVRESYHSQEEIWHNLDHRRLFTALTSLGL